MCYSCGMSSHVPTSTNAWISLKSSVLHTCVTRHRYCLPLMSLCMYLFVYFSCLDSFRNLISCCWASVYISFLILCCTVSSSISVPFLPLRRSKTVCLYLSIATWLSLHMKSMGQIVLGWSNDGAWDWQGNIKMELRKHNVRVTSRLIWLRAVSSEHDSGSLQVTLEAGNFVSSWATNIFWRRTLLPLPQQI